VAPSGSALRRAMVNRLPQGTTLFPQATISVSIVDCATGFLRDFE
jgi:hypothetical protein